MKKAKVTHLSVVDTVVSDIMENENDLFNNYTHYELDSVEELEDTTIYTIYIHFLDNTSQKIVAEYFKNDSVVYYKED